MSACPSCGAPTQEGAPFCNHCGTSLPRSGFTPPPTGFAPPPQGFAAAPPLDPRGMRICPSCGAIAPVQGTGSCTMCGHSLADVAFAAPRSDGVMFALIGEVDFVCRSCGLRTPMDGLDLDGQVDCRRCGTTQIFDVDQWDEGMSHAHDVADLSGPEPTGWGCRVRNIDPLPKPNPYANLGVTNTFAEKTLTGMTIDARGMTQHSLRVKVSAGHPVCGKGHGPLTVDVALNGGVKTTCARCNETGIYALPSNAQDIYDDDIVGCIDAEHRTDRRAVGISASPGGGAVAITCPQCSANLPAAPGVDLITCPYCQCAARIPRKVLAKLTSTQPVSTPFWLLFRGDSALRCQLEGYGGDDDDDDDDDHHPHPPPQQFHSHGQPVTVYAQSAAKTGIAITAMTLLMMLGIGGFVAWQVHRATDRAMEISKQASAKTTSTDKSGDDDDDSSKKKKPAIDTKSPAKVASDKAERARYRDLGCTCKAQLAGKDVTVKVALRVDSKKKPATADWILDVDGEWFPLVDENEADAVPPRAPGASAMSLDLACGDDVVVLAAGTHASGWSLVSKRARWTSDLGAAIPAPPAAGAARAISVACNALTIDKSSLTIPLAGGKSVSVRVADGTVK